MLAGFFIAGGTRSLYAGSFTDPNGVALTIAGLDANLAGFTLLLVPLAAAVVLARGAAEGR